MRCFTPCPIVGCLNRPCFLTARGGERSGICAGLRPRAMFHSMPDRRVPKSSMLPHGPGRRAIWALRRAKASCDVSLLARSSGTQNRPCFLTARAGERSGNCVGLWPCANPRSSPGPDREEAWAILALGRSGKRWGTHGPLALCKSQIDRRAAPRGSIWQFGRPSIGYGVNNRTGPQPREFSVDFSVPVLRKHV